MASDPQTVKVLERADGKAKVFILKRDDGLYVYRGFVEIDHDGDIFWGLSEESGLYDNAEHAEAGAISDVPWLRQISGSGD
jgi:hypothetical protein